MVYLIHFEKKYQHAQHYIGWVMNKTFFGRRIAYHRSGSGAHLMAAVSQAGIEWKVVRTWKDGTHDFERRLHSDKKSSRLCPICNPTGWDKNRKEIK